MNRLPLILPLLLCAAAAPADEAPFDPAPERFADAEACVGHLRILAADAEGQGYEAVRGPYEIAAGDIRIHMVRAEGAGHRIWEHRCLGQALASRTWHHGMKGAEEFTIDSVAREAEWLKQDAPEQ